MYLCTQRCARTFPRTHVPAPPAPRSQHMPTACVRPRTGSRHPQAAPSPREPRPPPGRVNRLHRLRREPPHPHGGGGGAASAGRRLGAPAGLSFIFKKTAPHTPGPSAAGAGGRERSEAGRAPRTPSRSRRRRRLPLRGAPPPPAPPPRARPAQAARVCFAARPPPPRASRAHFCLAGPRSALPSVECLSRWLLRTVWLFPLVTAFPFCLNSSPRSPCPRAPPPPAAGRVRPRPSPRGGSTSARHLGTRAALPAPARPAPIPRALRSPGL